MKKTDDSVKVHTHKGTDIFLDGTRFRALINSRHVYAPSVDALKKRIDNAVAFEPFDALVEGPNYTVLTLHVIGVEKDQFRRSGVKFRVENDKEHRPYGGVYTVYPVSARPLLVKLQAAKKRLEDAKTAYEEESGRLYGELNKLARHPE